MKKFMIVLFALLTVSNHSWACSKYEMPIDAAIAPVDPHVAPEETVQVPEIFIPNQGEPELAPEDLEGGDSIGFVDCFG
jgi:hypothetical protein